MANEHFDLYKIHDADDNKQVCIEKIKYYEDRLIDSGQLSKTEIDTYEWFLNKWKEALKKFDMVNTNDNFNAEGIH